MPSICIKIIKNKICYYLNSILKSINNGVCKGSHFGLLHFDEIVIVCCAQIHTWTDPPHYGNLQQYTHQALLVIYFPWKIPLWSLFTFSASWFPWPMSQTNSARSPCNSAVNRGGTYFSNFENSQKINWRKNHGRFWWLRKKVEVRGTLTH